LAEAEECEAQLMEDFDPKAFVGGCYMPMVGDVVECTYPASSWYDGHKDWRVWRERGGRFLTGYYALWVVVAKIPYVDTHQWRYVLWSPSSIYGKPRVCWTGPGHTRCHFNRYANDDEMREAKAAADMIAPNRLDLL